MKRIIVNADDLGADIARNQGIIEAIDAGGVSSVSILANAPALDDALCRIRALDSGAISFGVHFNLSEGFPVSSGLKRLVGPEGSFHGKLAAQKLFVHPWDSELENEIDRELDAQISKLLNAGIPLDHADGHQHIHILPAVIRTVIDLSRFHGIPWIRIPEEHASQLPDLPDNESEEAFFFCTHATAARPLYEASGLMVPEHFRGLYFKGKLPDLHWSEFLQGIPNGLTELMVHPGRISPEIPSGPLSRFSTADREKELLALTDGRFRHALLKTNVELTRFPQRPR
jgi:chitin disaccharide deacetylase